MNIKSAENFIARAIALSVIVGLLVYAYPRFLSSFLESPNYNLLEEFKGGNIIGFRYAYVGAWLLTGSQIYVLLKYLVKDFKMRIGLSRWMDLHCMLNITGFTLVLIHAGFPYSFRYWEPFTRLNIFSGLEGLTGIRGILTWLILLAFISGMLTRYSKNIRVKSIMHKIHSYTVLPAFASAVIHIIISILFPTSR
ncbi:MAG: hypothetical protein NZ929_07625 [Aigarchaeota archaeon]|nr:hypothetical protein [Aigarchaeota archaeon]MDW7986112.1 hypothetical protein [Nitrososphaerota archaeon]